MFKTLFNTIVLLILLLVNMALFTWCVNHLEVDQPPLKKTLISNVQAEAPQKKLNPRHVEVVARSNTQQPLIKSLKPISPSLTHQNESNRRLVLQFKSLQIYLEKAERVKFENQLQRLNINSSHTAQVLAGPTPSENNIQSPQAAKLRALMVARIIYPYTQTVKMYYRPSLEEGKMIVEFFPVQTKNP